MLNLVWIDDAPKKSLIENREWPMALYAASSKKQAAYLICKTSFDPDRARKPGACGEIRAVILKYNHNLPGQDPFAGRRMLCDEKFSHLQEATNFVENFLKTHPTWQPLIV